MHLIVHILQLALKVLSIILEKNLDLNLSAVVSCLLALLELLGCSITLLVFQYFSNVARDNV